MTDLQNDAPDTTTETETDDTVATENQTETVEETQTETVEGEQTEAEQFAEVPEAPGVPDGYVGVPMSPPPA